MCEIHELQFQILGVACGAQLYMLKRHHRTTGNAALAQSLWLSKPFFLSFYRKILKRRESRLESPPGQSESLGQGGSVSHDGIVDCEPQADESFCDVGLDDCVTGQGVITITDVSASPCDGLDSIRHVDLDSDSLCVDSLDSRLDLH